MNKLKTGILVIIAAAALTWAGLVHAEGEVEFHPAAVEYTFGKAITFQGQVVGDVELERADLILEAPGTPSFIGAAQVSPGGELIFTYDLEQRPLPAFSTLSYHYQVYFRDGETYRTPEQTFNYYDTRMDWRELQAGVFTVYWYQGDLPFARQVLDAAQKGREKMLDLLQQPPDGREIDIFVYARVEDLQSTLAMAGQSWVAGHANPELGSVVVSLPPGADQALNLQRQIPHEIAHVVLYRFMGTEYQYLPSWVSEGIASQVEFFPNPEEEVLLEKARERRDLIPFSQLCQTMPTDPDQAALAYAQVDSLLDYIRSEYGVTGVQAMIAAYDQGVGCERGVEMALGTSLKGLEKDWKQDTFSSGTLSELWYYFMPWLVLPTLLILPVLGIFFLRRYLRRDQTNREEEDV